MIGRPAVEIEQLGWRVVDEPVCPPRGYYSLVGVENAWFRAIAVTKTTIPS